MTIITAQPIGAPLPSLLDLAYTKYKTNQSVEQLLTDGELATEMQVLHRDGSLAPEYIYFGPGHMGERFWGRKFLTSVVGERSIPDHELGLSLRGRYPEVAWTEKPFRDKIVCAVFGRIFIQYERLILPTECFGGVPTYSVFLQLERMLDARPEACVQYPRGCSRSKNTPNRTEASHSPT